MNFQEDSEKVSLTPEMEKQLRQIVVNRATSELSDYGQASIKGDAFAELPQAAAAAFHLEQFGHAKELAERALALAPSFGENWNYGNAVHLGHTVLGLLALQEKDTQAAISQLLASGETPGSPQLNSFGPTMQLAKALLRQGETAAVLEYLKQCRAFWKHGVVWLDLWEQKVLAGQVPNCFQHSFA